MRESNQIRLRMILTLIVIEIILLCNILLVQLKILRPIITIKKQMLEISQGNLSAEFELHPDTSEIGTLVASIHETKHELKKYISDIDTNLAQMAQGNMELTISGDYRGEFQPIQRAMAQILDSFNDALSRINRTSERVSQESDKMSTSAQSLANGATEQAATVEELTASILDISKQVKTNASTAEDSASSAQELRNGAENLRIAVQRFRLRRR